MATKKRAVKQQPLLNTVARKLGHAAGKLTKVTRELTENLSALPEGVTTKVRKVVSIDTPANSSRNQSRLRTKKTRKLMRRSRAR
jgi:hypothetical protein